MKRFEQSEIKMIKESFELRKKDSDVNHTNKLNKIEVKLNLPIKHLSSLQRAIISGCIKELMIYPNEEILKKSDYELLLSRGEIEKNCIKIDIALSILNKVKKRIEPKRRLFRNTFEKIEKISSSKKVYYSISSYGNIYKVGIVTGKNRGMKTELGSTNIISNFKIDVLSGDTYMKSGKPEDLIKYLNHYGKENELNENHKRFIRIMEKPST